MFLVCVSVPACVQQSKAKKHTLLGFTLFAYTLFVYATTADTAFMHCTGMAHMILYLYWPQYKIDACHVTITYMLHTCTCTCIWKILPDKKFCKDFHIICRHIVDYP